MDETLKRRQEAGQSVERGMLDFLVQFTPAHEMKLGDVMLIAAHARRLAFNEFSEIENQRP